MNLIIHHFRKDTYRLRGLLIVWFLLVASQALIMGSGLFITQDDYVLQTAARIIPFLQLFLLVVVVPRLIHEEPLMGTTDFWFTRPISGQLLLRSKSLFVLLWLLIPPLVAELLAMAANGVTLRDISLAIPEILIDRLSTILVIAALAVVTPNFDRFARIAVIIFVAYTIGTMVIMFIRIGSFAGGNGLSSIINSATLSREYVIGISVLTMVGGLLVVVHQYVTRNTIRSVVLLIASAAVLGLVSSLWRPQPLTTQPDFDLKDFNSEAIQLSLVVGKTTVKDAYRSRQNQARQKQIDGELEIVGQLPKYDLRPVSWNAELSFAGKTNFIQQGMRVRNIFRGGPPRAAIEGALNGARVANPSELLSCPTLMVLNEDNYNHYFNETGSYSAKITFNIYQYKVAAELPLNKGSRYDQDSEHMIISDVAESPSGVSVVIRESKVNLLLKQSAMLYQKGLLGSLPDDVYYLLFNKKTGQAFLPDVDGFDMSELFGGSKARLIVGNKTLDYAGGEDRFHRQLPEINKEWLADAVLVRVETMYRGEFTKKLEVDNFQLAEQLKQETYEEKKARVNLLASEKLKTIVLPENPSRDDVEKYIQAIITVSENISATRYGSDSQVAMLAKVGATNMDLLLAQCGASYVSVAINRLAGPEHKEMILQHLATCPELVDTVIEQGWIEDARGILLAAPGLKMRPQPFINPNWIDAVARLKDPSTYDDLKYYFVHASWNKIPTYYALKRVPGLDLSDVVAQAWENSKFGDKRVVREMAEIAMENGNLDALQTLVETLEDADLPLDYRAQLISSIRRVSTAPRISGEIIDWYKKNRDRIVFDKEIRRFVTPDGISTEQLEVADVLFESPPISEIAVETPKGSSRAKLDAIVLPANPSREEAARYIDAIIAVTKTIHEMRYTRDPQVDMLAKVGPTNIDLLMARYGESYVSEAINRLAGPEHKEMILQHLAACPELVDAVMEQGWLEDAREILLAAPELKMRPQPFINPNWIAAVARLKDPSTYDDLKYYFVHAPVNKHCSYYALRNLPGFDLADAVAQAWENSKNTDEGTIYHMAPIAMEYGHIDALEMAVALLKNTNFPDGGRKELIAAIEKYSPASGTSEQIIAWYEKNKDRLVFDANAKKFIIRDASAEPSGTGNQL